MIRIREYRKADLPALYQVSVMTGDGGGDARHLYQDPDLMGHIYVGPYAECAPDLCFVAEDDLGPAGYIVGTVDTRPFEALLERAWWPSLRARYPDPGAELPPDCDADTKRAHRMHYTAVIPDAVVAACPGHLHMNLLPRLQRQGIGTRLLERWFSVAREAGAERVHVGVNPGNTGGLAFWLRAGFERINLPEGGDSARAVWLGRPVP
ncbi:GNAT family N-acetyltransferase [Nisaea sp.]|uniref:GNAT family N-acetyltransferase n=1 Tax=Nisaea sp. TaxID=2024842 RepID=UPI0032647ACB